VDGATVIPANSRSAAFVLENLPARDCSPALKRLAGKAMRNKKYQISKYQMKASTYRWIKTFSILYFVFVI
jgi:hypothetical protein